jgi:hypothetical protein
MIWTVMLGFVLTSVFFFFGMRQRLMLGAQRDTIEQMNAKSYMESLSEYFEKNANTVGEKELALDGIQIRLTQVVTEIIGSVDVGVTESYLNVPNGIFVEWNPCSDRSFVGDIMVNGVRYPQDKLATCGNREFKDIQGPLNVGSPMTINAADSPVKYRIRAKDQAALIDNRWHLSLTKTLDYGKVLSISKTFK